MSYQGVKQFVSRFMYEQIKGKVPEGMVVRHDCDNTECINPDHLRTGSRAQNVQDMVVRNRHARGERHADAKLTKEQALEIYQADQVEAFRLGEEYGISKSAVYQILKGITWTHITQPQIEEDLEEAPF